MSTTIPHLRRGNTQWRVVVFFEDGNLLDLGLLAGKEPRDAMLAARGHLQLHPDKRNPVCWQVWDETKTKLYFDEPGWEQKP